MLSRTLCGALMLCLFSASVFADTLAVLPFSDVTTISGKVDVTPQSSALIDVIVSASSDLGASSKANGLFSFSSWTIASTFQSLYFYSLVLNPHEGVSASIDSIQLTIGRSSTGPMSWGLKSSLDNYLSFSGTLSGNSMPFIENADHTFQFATDNTSTADYTGVVWSPDVSMLIPSSGMELRLFAWSSESTLGTFRLDDVNINGSIQSIPEPSTYLLIAIVIVALYFQTSRKHYSELDQITN